MIDSFIAFVLLWAFSWPALVFYVLLGIWSEYTEARGFAVFWAIIAALSAFFYFDVSLRDLAIYVVGYLVAGVIWSFFRYKRFIVAKVELYKEVDPLNTHRVTNYHPSNMLDTITAWIIIWPFSLIENLCGDIIHGIETLVKKVFKGVYNRIYESATAGLPQLKKEK